MKALVTVKYMKPGDEVDRMLRAAGFETVHNSVHPGRTEDELIALLDGADAAIAGMDPFTARVIEASPRLRVVARPGVGYDTVDVAAATRRGVAVCTAPGNNARSVADYTVALLLDCARRLFENLVIGRDGGWQSLPGYELAGRTLGIVGLGTIGKHVATRARAFEMRILAHDPIEDAVFATAQAVSYVPLDELLRDSDYVTLHTYLDAGTRHLIDARRLALMKPTAYLINTSRGGVVDTAALTRALAEGRIAGCALDVVEDEPLPRDHPLRALANVRISPHAAGATLDARTRAARLAAENAIRVVRGERPHAIVNPAALTRQSR